MNNRTLVLAAAFVAGLVSAASAQSADPQIPTWANPAPANPVATDGSSLAPHAAQVYVPNRSAFVALADRGSVNASDEGRVINVWGQTFTVK